MEQAVEDKLFGKMKEIETLDGENPGNNLPQNGGFFRVEAPCRCCDSVFPGVPVQLLIGYNGKRILDNLL